MKTTLLLVLLGLCSAYAGTFFIKTDWYKAMGWCRHSGSKVYIGDFNGDGRSDMLCHDNIGRTWTILANRHGNFNGQHTLYNGKFRWCSHAGSELYVGDFNGDRRTDILCHDTKGRVWTSLATAAGYFTGTSWYIGNSRWCYHKGSQLFVGDFNGDGRSDILCHDNRGRKWISYAKPGGSFPGTTWYKAMGWCYHRGARLQIDDFNGDGRDDMMCHDNIGRKWVALATCEGIFKTTSWYGLKRWCSGRGAQLLTGHFNDDARADLMCHHRHTGHKWIALARRDYRRLFVKTDWQRAMRWCGSTGELHIGDFNGDGKDDLLCHEHHTGRKWISYNKHQL